MLKNINKIVLAFVLVLTSASPIFAGKSGYSPYSPYGGHTPVPTSFAGGADILIISAIAIYLVAMLTIALSTKLKAKISA